jgi:hypothetical protein
MIVISATVMLDVSMASNILIFKISVRLTLQLVPILNSDNAKKCIEKLFLGNSPYERNLRSP